MRLIDDGSIDMILCDLPYGVTSCKWDSILPMDRLWQQYWRIIKPNGAIALTAAQPFTTVLIQSCRQWFRYCWYWNKNQVTGFPFAKRQPLRCVEEIAVFYKRAPTYNPQGLVKLDKPIRAKKRSGTVVYREGLKGEYEQQYTNYPRQTLNFKCQRDGLHPTQKPVELFSYLIQTYTNPGEIVLDNCMGSGTTAIAAIETKRNFIGFEISDKYYKVAIERIGTARE